MFTYVDQREMGYIVGVVGVNDIHEGDNESEQLLCMCLRGLIGKMGFRCDLSLRYGGCMCFIKGDKVYQWFTANVDRFAYIIGYCCFCFSPSIQFKTRWM